jgi:hypothetical protein
MFSGFDIREELIRNRDKSRKENDFVLDEVHRILAESSFTEKHILDNLRQYNRTFTLLDEEGLDKTFVFKEADIKRECIGFRLKFLDSRHYKPEVPYEAILKISHLNSLQKKDLQDFKILGKSGAFKNKDVPSPLLLFAPTVYGNYYLVHAWGCKLKWYQKIKALPLRNFEVLLCTVALIALTVTMSLPTWLITLDHEATYWCGYRVAAFLHLFIFFSGMTAYLLVGFNKNFNGSVWRSEKEFD